MFWTPSPMALQHMQPDSRPRGQKEKEYGERGDISAAHEQRTIVRISSTSHKLPAQRRLHPVGTGYRMLYFPYTYSYDLRWVCNLYTNRSSRRHECRFPKQLVETAAWPHFPNHSGLTFHGQSVPHQSSSVPFLFLASKAVLAEGLFSQSAQGAHNPHLSLIAVKVPL